MTKRTRIILTFVAATLAAVVAAAGTAGLPPLVTVILAAVVAGLAAIGIIPPKLTQPIHGAATTAYFTDPITHLDDVPLAAAAELGGFAPVVREPGAEKFAVILTATDSFGNELARYPAGTFMNYTPPATFALRLDYRDMNINHDSPAPFYVNFVTRIVRFDPETDVTTAPELEPPA